MGLLSPIGAGLLAGVGTASCVALPGVPSWAALLPVFSWALGFVVCRTPIAWALWGFLFGFSLLASSIPAFWPSSPWVAVGAPLLYGAYGALAFGGGGWLLGRQRGSALGWACPALTWLVVAGAAEQLRLPNFPLSATVFASLPGAALGARFVGLLGLDALALLCAAGLARCVLHGRPAVLLVGVSSLALLAGLAHASPHRVLDEAQLHLIQPNIPIAEYRAAGWALPARAALERRLDRLTSKAAAARPGLVVWPEGGSAVPDLQVARRRRALHRILAGKSSALVASTEVLDGRRRFNAAGLIVDGAVRGTGYKAALVPLAESTLSPGPSRVLDSPFGRFGIGICFDSTMAGVWHDLSAQRPEYVVITSNDASFGDSTMTALHTAVTRLRGLEHGLPVALASNAGPTFAWDQDGELLGSLPARARGVLSVRIPRVRPSRFASPLLGGGLWLCGLAGLGLVYRGARR